MLDIQHVKTDCALEGYILCASMLRPLLKQSGASEERLLNDLACGRESLLHLYEGDRLAGCAMVRRGDREGHGVLIITSLAGHFSIPWIKDLSCYLTILATCAACTEIEWLTRHDVEKIAMKEGFIPVGTLYRKGVC